MISKKIAATLDGGRPEKLLALVSDVVDSLLEPARKNLQAAKDGAEAAVAEARRAGALALGGDSGGPGLAPPRRFESIGDQVQDPEDTASARLQSALDKGRVETFRTRPPVPDGRARLTRSRGPQTACLVFLRTLLGSSRRA